MRGFDTVINGEHLTIYQNSSTGLFYTILNDIHIPVDFDVIKDETTIGQRIKYWRCQYGYTQSQLATLLNVSSSNVIAMWENGRRAPTKNCLEKLADYLDYSLISDYEKCE